MNPNRPEGLLRREEGEGEEKDGARNGDDQSGTLVLEDTDTGQSIGSSRREYLLLEEGIEEIWERLAGVALSRPEIEQRVSIMIRQKREHQCKQR